MLLIILKDSELQKTFLQGILVSLEWEDDTTNNKAALVATKVVKYIGKYEISSLYEWCGIVMEKCLQFLAKKKIGDSQAISEFIILIATIIQTVGGLTKKPIQVINKIPNVDESDLKHLTSFINSAQSGRHITAAFRSCVKSFTLKYVVGKLNTVSSSFGHVVPDSH